MPATKAARSCWCSRSIWTAAIAATPVVALDAVDAGVGDRVLLVTEGFSAMTAVGRPQSPIDMAVIGFIDLVDLLPGVD